MFDYLNPETLRVELKKLSDEKYRQFHSRICITSQYRILGVRLPVLRKLSRAILKDKPESFLDSVQPVYYEEVMLKALVLAGLKKPLCDKINDIETFVPLIDNWAVCDTFSSSLKPKKNELELLLDFIKRHIYGCCEYEIRLAVVLLLQYYVDSEHIDEVLSLLGGVDCTMYYTSMAVAWALSVCYVKFKDKTEAYLKSSCLDLITLRRTVGKIRDSYRVSEEDKNKANLLLKQKKGEQV